jgi:hypothetical protein
LNIRKTISLLLLTLSVVFSSYAQQAPPAETPQEKTKYFGKIGHWILAYGYSGEEFMREKRNDFKASAFAEVYVEGLIDYQTWMFDMLNRVTKVRNDDKQDPYVLFNVKFTPTDDKFEKYKVSYVITADWGSKSVTVNLEKIGTDTNNQFLANKTYETPAAAQADLESAIRAALDQLQNKLKTELAPNVLVRYNGEVFWSGHEIGILDSEGNYVTLEAIDKDLKLLSSDDITWTNAEHAQSTGIVDMTDVSSKTVTLTKKPGGTDNTASVVVKRTSMTDDINELLKQLIIEALTSKKKEAQDTLVTIRKDSTDNISNIAKQIALLEDGNYQLESSNDNVKYVFAKPTLVSEEDSIAAFDEKGTERRKSFDLLHKRKKIKNLIRKKVNVVAFADLVVDHPDEIKGLLEELLKNSGRLVAQLITSKDEKGKKDAARNIVVDFINKNIERIAGNRFAATEPPPVVLPVTAIPKPVSFSFSDEEPLYISPNVAFKGKDIFFDSIRIYLRTLSPRMYVAINYSQDDDTRGFMERLQGSKLKNLANGQEYLAITLVNIPGSVTAQFVLSSNKELPSFEPDAASISEKLKKVIKVTGGQSIQFFSAGVTNIEKLKNFANKDKTGKILSYTFISPSGKPFSLPPNITEVIFSTGDAITGCGDETKFFAIAPFGTLIKFRWNDKLYSSSWNCVAKEFNWYEAGFDKYNDGLTNETISKAIIGLPTVEEGSAKVLFKVGQLNITPQKKADEYHSGGRWQEFDFLNDRIKEVKNFENVYATFDPDFDAEVRQFILDNIGNDGFDGQNFYDNDMYVFTHATQLQNHAILKGCFRTGVPGALLRLIKKYANAIGPGAIPAQIPVFEFSLEEGPDARIANIKTLVNNWKKYDLNFYPWMAKAVNEFNIPEEALAVDVYPLLAPLQLSSATLTDNWNCFWDKIKVEQRASLLKQFAKQNRLGDRREEVILLLIKTLHADKDQTTMLDNLAASNYSLLKTVWYELDAAERIDLTMVLFDWLKRLKPYEANFVTKTWDQQAADLEKAKQEHRDFVIGKVFRLYRFTELDRHISEKFSVTFDQTEASGQNCMSISEDLTDEARFNSYDAYKYGWGGRPFDWVVLYVKEDIPEFNLKANYLIPVPAIYLYGIDQCLEGKDHDLALRVGGNMVAIALAPVTAGGSTTLMLIEIGAAVVDIHVAMNKAELEKKYGDTVLAWEVLYAGYNLFMLGRNFFVPTRTNINGVSTITKITIEAKYTDEFAKAIATDATSLKKITQDGLDGIISVLKASDDGKNAKLIDVLSSLIEVRFKAQRAVGTTSQLNNIIVKNGELVIDGLSLGAIDVKNGVITMAKGSRWDPTRIKTKVVDKFVDITVNGKKQTIEVIQDVADARQFYLRATEVESLFKEYSSIVKWIKGISDVDNWRGVQSTISSWSKERILQLNQALKDHPGLAAELSDGADVARLLSRFEQMNSNWWYKIGMLRDHYRNIPGSVLPKNFETIALNLKNRANTATIGERLRNASKALDELGNILEEEIVPLIAKGIETGKFEDMPVELARKLGDLRNQGYKVMLTQPKVGSVDGAYVGKPELDMLLFKYDAEFGLIDYQSGLYLDVKLASDAAFDGAQANFTKGGLNKMSFIEALSSRQNTLPEVFAAPDVSVDAITTLRNVSPELPIGFQLVQTAKIGTAVDKNGAHIVIYKEYNPR